MLRAALLASAGGGRGHQLASQGPGTAAPQHTFPWLMQLDPRKESCPDPWLPETPGTVPSPFTQRRKSRGPAPPSPPRLPPPDCALGPHVPNAPASQGRQLLLLPASHVSLSC